MLTSAMWREFSETSNFALYTVEEPEEDPNIVVRPSPRGPMASVDLLPSEKQSRSKKFSVCYFSNERCYFTVIVRYYCIME